MNVNEDHSQVLIDRYLAGKASEEEIILVEVLMAKLQDSVPISEVSKEEREEYEANLMIKVQEIKAEITENPYVSPISLQKKRTRNTIIYAVAAGFALTITFGILRYYIKSPSNKSEIEYTTYQAPIGKPSYLRLSDSSEIWLNEGTKFRYPKQFSKDIREVEILDGEAFFDIHHEVNRPFLVHSGLLTTKDIGTSFNIKSYRNGRFSTVSVISGQVFVGLKSGKAQNLKPDQQIQYDSVSKEVKISNFSSSNLLSWKEGGFYFLDERLGDIVEELKHRFQVEVRLKEPNYANYHFTAKFPKGTSAFTILKLFCDLNNNTLKQINSKEFLIQ